VFDQRWARSDGDAAGVAVLDDEGSSCGDRRALCADEVDGAVVGGPRIGGDDVADVAALAVDEPDVRVLGELNGVTGVVLDAVATGGDRRADDLGGDCRRRRVLELP
jgi:hypothetical protein